MAVIHVEIRRGRENGKGIDPLWDTEGHGGARRRAKNDRGTAVGRTGWQ